MSTMLRWMNGLTGLWDAARQALLRDPYVIVFERSADHAQDRTRDRVGR